MLALWKSGGCKKPQAFHSIQLQMMQEHPLLHNCISSHCIKKLCVLEIIGSAIINDKLISLQCTIPLTVPTLRVLFSFAGLGK